MHLVDLPKKKVTPKLFPGFYWATTKKDQNKITDNTKKTRLLIVRISGKEPFLIWETWHISGQSPKRYRAIEHCPNFVLGQKIQHYGVLNPNIIDVEKVVPGFYWGKLITATKNDVIIYVFGKKPFLKLLALNTVNGNIYTINNIDSIRVISRIQQPCVYYTTIKPIVKKQFTILKA